MLRKYILLFEEHSVGAELDETTHTWADIRDAIQTRRPFTIINFSSSEEYNKCLNQEIFDESFAKQSFNQNIEGELKEFPSVFIFEPKGGLHDRVKTLFSKFKLNSILIGDEGKEFVTIYYTSGESSKGGNDLLNGLNPEDVGGDQFYRIGSQYYKFIETL